MGVFLSRFDKHTQESPSEHRGAFVKQGGAGVVLSAGRNYKNNDSGR